jgi:trimeric autotransporter adhesin
MRRGSHLQYPTFTELSPVPRAVRSADAMASAPGAPSYGHVVYSVTSAQGIPTSPSGPPVVGFPLVSGAPGQRPGPGAPAPHASSVAAAAPASGSPHTAVGEWLGGVIGEVSGLIGAAVASAHGGDDESGMHVPHLVAPPPAFPPAEHPFWRRPDVAEKVLFGVSQLHSERCLAVAAAEAATAEARRRAAAIEALQHALEAEQLRCSALETRTGKKATQAPGGGDARPQAAVRPGAASATSAMTTSAQRADNAVDSSEVESLRERVALLQSLLADERSRNERASAASSSDVANGGNAAVAALTAQLEAERATSARLEARLQAWLDARSASSSEVERLNRAIRDRDAQAAEAAQRFAQSEARLRGEIEHLLRQGERRQDDMLTLEAVRHERANAEKAARDAGADVARLQQTLATVRAALKEEQGLRKDLELRLSWEGSSAAAAASRAAGAVPAAPGGKTTPAPRTGESWPVGDGSTSSSSTAATGDASSSSAATKLAAAEIARLEALLVAERKKAADVALGAARAVAAAKAAAAKTAGSGQAPASGEAAAPVTSSAAGTAAASAALAAANTRADVAEVELRSVKQTVEKLHSRIEESGAKLDAVRGECDSLRSQLASHQSQVRSLTAELATVSTALATEQAITASLRAEAAKTAQGGKGVDNGGDTAALKRAEARAAALADSLSETQAELARLKIRAAGSPGQQQQQQVSSPVHPSSPGAGIQRSESGNSLDGGNDVLGGQGPRKSSASSGRKPRMR